MKGASPLFLLAACAVLRSLPCSESEVSEVESRGLLRATLTRGRCAKPEGRELPQPGSTKRADFESLTCTFESETVGGVLLRALSLPKPRASKRAVSPCIERNPKPRFGHCNLELRGGGAAEEAAERFAWHKDALYKIADYELLALCETLGIGVQGKSTPELVNALLTIPNESEKQFLDEALREMQPKQLAALATADSAVGLQERIQPEEKPATGQRETRSQKRLRENTQVQLTTAIKKGFLTRNARIEPTAEPNVDEEPAEHTTRAHEYIRAKFDQQVAARMHAQKKGGFVGLSRNQQGVTVGKEGDVPTLLVGTHQEDKGVFESDSERTSGDAANDRGGDEDGVLEGDHGIDDDVEEGCAGEQDDGVQLAKKAKTDAAEVVHYVHIDGDPVPQWMEKRLRKEQMRSGKQYRYCQHPYGCTRFPCFGQPWDRVPRFCLEHRHDHHINVRHLGKNVYMGLSINGTRVLDLRNILVVEDPQNPYDNERLRRCFDVNHECERCGAKGGPVDVYYEFPFLQRRCGTSRIQREIFKATTGRSEPSSPPSEAFNSSFLTLPPGEYMDDITEREWMRFEEQKDIRTNKDVEDVEEMRRWWAEEKAIADQETSEQHQEWIDRVRNRTIEVQKIMASLPDKRRGQKGGKTKASKKVQAGVASKKTTSALMKGFGSSEEDERASKDGDAMQIEGEEEGDEDEDEDEDDDDEEEAASGEERGGAETGSSDFGHGLLSEDVSYMNEVNPALREHTPSEDKYKGEIY